MNLARCLATLSLLCAFVCLSANLVRGQEISYEYPQTIGWGESSQLLLSPDGSQLAQMTDHGQILVIDLGTEEAIMVGKALTADAYPSELQHFDSGFWFVEHVNAPNTYGRFYNWGDDEASPPVAMPSDLQFFGNARLSPDGSTVYTSEESREVTVRNPATGAFIDTINTSELVGITLTVDETESYLVTITLVQLQVIDLENGVPIAEIDLPDDFSEQAVFESVAFIPGTTQFCFIAEGSDNNDYVNIYDAATGGRVDTFEIEFMGSFNSFDEDNRDFQFTADGSKYIFNYGQTIHSIDLMTETMSFIDTNITTTCMALDDDGTKAYAGIRGEDIIIEFDLTTGERVRIIDSPFTSSNDVNALPNENLIMTSTDIEDGNLFSFKDIIYDIRRREAVRDLFLFGFDRPINQVIPSPNGEFLGVATRDFTENIQLTSTRTGAEIGRLEQLDRGNEEMEVTGFTSDGSLALVLEQDFVSPANFTGILNVRETSTGELVREVNVASGLFGRGFSPNGNRVVGSDDNDLIVWETASGQELWRVNDSRTFNNEVHFISNGNLLLIENDDDIELRDSATGEVLRTFEDAAAQTYPWRPSPAGTHLLTVLELQVSLPGDYATEEEELVTVPCLQVFEIASGELVRTIVNVGSTTMSFFDSEVGFSPDGTEVYFNNSGVLEIYPTGLEPQQPDQIEWRELPLDITLSEDISRLQTIRYRSDVTQNDNLLVEVTPMTTGSELIVEGSFTGTSLNALSDDITETLTPRGTYELLLPSVPTSEVIISVRERSTANQSSNYEIRATVVDNWISMVDPGVAGNGGEVTFLLDGIFTEIPSSINLVPDSGPMVSAFEIIRANNSEVWSTFDLATTQIGLYDVEANFSGGSVTLENSVEIVDGDGPGLAVTNMIPPYGRRNRATAGMINVTNIGDHNAKAPLLSISSAEDSIALVQDQRDALFSANSFIYLAAPESGPADRIRPMQTASIRYYARPLGESDEIVVQELEELATPVNWSLYRDVFRPTDADVDDWNNNWNNLTALFGTTWEDFADTMREEAVRTSLRGQDPTMLSIPLERLYRRSLGEPTAAISGRVRDVATGGPVQPTTVKAVAQNGDTIRLTETNPTTGHFVLNHLPADVYQITIEDYRTTDTITAEIIGDGDVNNLELIAETFAQDIVLFEEEIPAAEPVLASIPSGETILVYNRGGQLYGSVDDGDGYSSPTLIDANGGGDLSLTTQFDAVSSETVLILTYARDDSDPQDQDGQNSLFWRKGRLNQDGDLEWTNIQQLTNDGFHDTFPASIEDPVDNQIIVTWLQKDLDLRRDDDDLYTKKFDASTATFKFIQSDQIIFVEKSNGCGTINNFLQLPSAEIPEWVPGVGGKYGLNDGEVGLDLSTDLNDICNPSVTLATSADFTLPLNTEINGVISGTLDFGTDPESCARGLRLATAAIVVDGSTRFYTPRMPFTVGPIPCDWRISIGFEGTASASVIWQGENFPSFPPDRFELNELSLTGLPEGEVRVLSGVGGAKLGGIFGADLGLNSNDDLEFQAWRLGFSGELYAFGGWIKYGISEEWEFESTKNQKGLSEIPDFDIVAELPPPLSMDTQVTTETFVRDNVLVTKLIYSEPDLFPSGSTNVYEGTVYRNDDGSEGPPALIYLGGTPTLIWTKQALSPEIGSTVEQAVWNGSQWMNATPVDDNPDFSVGVDAASSPCGEALAIWSNASNSGITNSTTTEDLLDRLNGADIQYARYTNGSWSNPITLDGSRFGQAFNPAIAMNDSCEGVAVWLQDNQDGTFGVVGSYWNGTFWENTMVLKEAAFIDLPDIVATQNGFQAIWAQDTDGDIETRSDRKLFSAVYDGQSWLPPNEVIFETEETETPKLIASEDKGSVILDLFNCLLGVLSEDCCGEDREPLPPISLDDIAKALENDLVSAQENTSLLYDALGNGGRSQFDTIFPVDPNEKAGPAGNPFFDDGLLLAEPIFYTIYFENKEEAAAAAQEVFVTDQLPEELDFQTFEPLGVAFGETVSTFEQDEENKWSVTIPYTDVFDGEDYVVEVSVTINRTSGFVNWTFRTQDPDLEDFPTNPFAGFLPPNDENGLGEGLVTFMIMPEQDVPRQTPVENEATIVFDTEAPIITNTVRNTLWDLFPIYDSMIVY